MISHRLYRCNTVHMRHNKSGEIHYIKDLSRLGRPLERTIIIDNLKTNYMWQKQNGVHISTWTDDEDDDQLLQLIPLLRQVVERQPTDVRPIL